MSIILSLSDLLGYTSIACWLGAQFPQVLENIRLKSCEGLALPFLANWLLGDVSNLIGCILTHQLPFQTWLATYFVCVDFMLVSQYFYYQGLKSKPTPSHVSSRARGNVPRLSSDRIVPRYRNLSVVAANVATAAALAAQAQQDERVESRQSHPRRQHSSVDRLGSASRISRDTAGDDEGDENIIAALADSFHSEGAQISGRKRVSWSTERYGRGGSVGRSPTLPRLGPATLRMTSPGAAAELVDSLSRGRSLQRESDFLVEPQVSVDNRRSSRASRRSAGLVFLGVWAMFSVGTLAGIKRGLPSSSATNVGRVLTSTLDLPYPVPVTETFIKDVPLHITHNQPIVHKFTADGQTVDDSPHEEPPSSDPSAERVLGRIFAWLCTTLYLTSRLPQIWKNFVRKSVEGLSMYLFIFAFLGNSFYVASIITSPNVFLPPPASTEFIRESIPYLLGSGGTLVFDITIVSQSLIYRRRRRRHGSSTRSRSRMVDEEEAGLLTGDALAHGPRSSSESVAQPRGRTFSSTRTVS